MRRRDAILWGISMILWLSFFLLAQKEKPDKAAELESRLKASKDAEKIAILMELSKLSLEPSPQKALEYADAALQLAEKLKKREEKVLILVQKGDIYYALNDYQKSLESVKRAVEMVEGQDNHHALHIMSACHEKLGDSQLALEKIDLAMRIADKAKDKRAMAKYLNHAGLVYKMISDYDTAIAYYLQSMKLWEELGVESQTAILLNNIGNIYYRIENYQMALDYHLKSMKIKEKTGNTKGIAASYTNIGNIYFNLKDYQKSLEYHQKSLQLKKQSTDLKAIAISQANIAECHIILGNQAKALECIQEAFDIFMRIGYRNGIATSLYQLGEVNFLLSRYAKSNRYLQESLKLAEEIKAKNLIMDNYSMLSELHAGMGDYRKALEYYKRFHEVDKEILNESSSRQIVEAQTRFDTLKKTREIERLQNEKAIDRMRVSRARAVRNAIILGFGLVLLVFVLLIKKYMYLFAFWKKQKYIGQYRLLDCVASGGMSLVYRAHAIRSKSQKVAVKVLKEEMSGEEDTVKRFMREGVIVDKLDHPHIVRILERGEDRQRLFLVMEYLEGETLAEKIGREGRLDLDVANHVMMQLAEVMLEIHAAGIVHRDLKPSNIFLIQLEGDPHFLKLLDFGLARRKMQTTLTRTGEILGTIGYMSPEQLLDGEITAASDVYAMGSVWYEMVCGRKVFIGENDIRVIRMVLNEAPVEPIRVRPEIPAETSRMIMRMLEKDSLRRPSLEELLESLHRSGEGI